MLSDSFSYYFSEIIQLNLKIFYTIAIFDLIRQLVPKICYAISKSVLTVNFFFEEKYWKMSTIIRDSIILKVSIRSSLILLSHKLVDPNFSNLFL